MQSFDLHQCIEAMITVKAYPRPSKKYGESVCIAAVRTDQGAPEFCRLYPVDFRGLPPSKQFHKYQVIQCLVTQPREDTRRESLCPLRESIEVIDSIRSWGERWRLLEPLMVESLCELQERQRRDATSLGLFKPGEIIDFTSSPTEDEWDEGQTAALQQGTLLPTRPRRPLERIPYRFAYRFRCANASCRGHDIQLIDWEVCELYRKLGDRPLDERLDLLRAKWLEELCAPDRDTYFFAGNMAKRPWQFQLLGVVWPRRSEIAAGPRPEPLALF